MAQYDFIDLHRMLWEHRESILNTTVPIGLVEKQGKSAMVLSSMLGTCQAPIFVNLIGSP